MAQVQDQVLQWLGGNVVPTDQEPLTIGHNIENMEQDFSNGYLIGQILTQYGICDNINTFSKKTNKEAKVHNFYQIEDALRRMKVQFDAKLIHNVMNEEPEASTKLLHIIKKGVQKLFSKSDQSVTGLKQKVVDHRVKKVKDLQVKLPSIHKEYGIVGPSIKGQNFQLIEEKLLKFELAKVNLFKKSIYDEKAERTMLMSIQQQKRQDLMNKLQENKEFMNEWNKTGLQNWKENRDTRAFEISRSEYFDDREVKLYRDNLDKELNFNTKDMQVGVAEFHENLRKLGVEENITIQEAIDRQEKKKGIPPGQIQNFSYAATMNKIKETKNQNEFAGKERERRQRKLKVDQIKIQEMLDSEKKEELMLQKLIAKQTEEQHKSYTNWRNEQCKQIFNRNKVVKAEKFKLERMEKTAQIEKEMRDEAIAGEDERQLLHTDNTRQQKLTRRDEKYKKRRLNVEIASEIIDLIMDVADESFNHQQEHKDDEDDYNRQLQKETWRNWMSIFSAGQKVSEANIVLQKDEVLEKQESEKNPIAKLLGLGSENMTAVQVVDRVKHQTIYSDFLQYVSISGSLNMHLYARSKWENMIRVIAEDPALREKNIEFDFLNKDTIPTNQELGQVIQELYSAHDMTRSESKNMIMNSPYQGGSTYTIHKTQSQLHQSKMEIIAEEETTERSTTQVPLWHTFKLCIMGKALSGKKSVAQGIKENLGEQITTFNMDDILREALQYVSPEKKDDVPDPKSKGKAKGVEAIADVFAGLDTHAYKEISHDLLKQVFVQTGQEKVPGKEVNLISLIKNDLQLVNLFIEKLKLTFNQPPQSLEEQEAKMKENLTKEEELKAQLAESLEQEIQAADQQNVKGGKPPKGGKNQAKSSKEIKDEIDNLMSVEKNGWVLVDFPRTINQAKLLENVLTRYKSPSDQPKQQAQQRKEIWSNLADPEEVDVNVSFNAQPSFFDSVFLLDVARDECIRRGGQRKMDPTNNMVYHMEDRAPPTNDQKLTERLQDFFGNHSTEHEMITYLDQSHLESCDNDPMLSQFYLEFGIIDQETSQGLQSFQSVSVSSKLEKDQVFVQINTKLQDILKFKQVQKDRDYETLRAKIIADQKAAEEATNEPMPENEEDPPVEEDQKPADQESRNTPGNQSSAGEKNQTQGRISDVTSEQYSKRSKSVSQSGIKRTKKKEFNRDYKIKLWEEMTLDYFREGMITMNQIKKQNETVTDYLNMSQTEFIQFLERPDEKQEIVNEFINSYNQFSDEFPDLRQDDQTKEELISRVEQLSIGLWGKIEQKKEESLNEILRQAEEGWSAQEMKQVCKSMARMIEIEIKKFTTVYQVTVEQDPPVELDAEIMVKKMLERGTKQFDAKSQTSPIFNTVISKLVQNLEDLTIQTYKEFNFGQNPNALVLEQEKTIFIYRLGLIQAWALTYLEEISIYSTEVYSLMDEWVVEAVSIENMNVQVVLDQISEFIRSSGLIMNEDDYVMHPTQLLGKIEIKSYGINQQPLYLQEFIAPRYEVEQTRFDTADLNNLFRSIRKINGEKGSTDLLDEQSYVFLLMLAFRQGRIPLTWKLMNIEKVLSLSKKFRQSALPSMTIGVDEPSEYQSRLNTSNAKNFPMDQNRQWVNWKRILLYFILLNSEVPSQDQINEYQAALDQAANGSQHISCESFINVCAWFDGTEGKADSGLTSLWLEDALKQSMVSEYEDQEVSPDQVYQRLDNDRLSSIKQLLFSTFRNKIGQDRLNIGELIQILNEMACNHEGKTFSEALFE